jgi:tRNA-dihydrouridine synthase B
MKIKFNKFIIALAPMAGVTDFAFRKICADYGADMVVTEMISLKALENKNFKTEKMLREEANAIRCCQLFCHDPETIEKAFEHKLFDHFDVIDFNCGCPAPKIVKNGDGSAMMRDIEKSQKVISNLVKLKQGVNLTWD